MNGLDLISQFLTFDASIKGLNLTKMLATSLQAASNDDSFQECQTVPTLTPQEAMICAMRNGNSDEYFKMCYASESVSANDARYKFIEDHKLVQFALPNDIIHAPERVSKKGCAWGDALWGHFSDPDVRESVIIELSQRDPWTLKNFGERFVKQWEVTLVQILNDEWIHTIFSNWPLPPAAEYECWRLGRSNVCKRLGYPLHIEWMDLHCRNVAVSWREELVTCQDRLCIAAKHEWNYYVDEIIQEMKQRQIRIAAKGICQLLKCNIELGLIYEAINNSWIDESCLHQCILSGRLLVLSTLATHPSVVTQSLKQHEDVSMLLWVVLFHCSPYCQLEMLESVASIVGVTKCINDLRKLHSRFENQSAKRANLCSQMFHHLRKEW